MSGRIQHPHDKLFRTVFADVEEAALFLRQHLPEALSGGLDWSSLALVETSFVDEALRESESDLLYSVQMKGSAVKGFLYLLFEHQSKPDAWMRFRLLKYMCRIWDDSFKEQPEQTALRPIVPVVFYQGDGLWRYSNEFADLFPEQEREHPFLPRFAHYLIDQSGLPPEQVKGGLKARVAQLLLMAAYRDPVRDVLRVAAPLMAQVTRSGGIDYVAVFVLYLAATQERRVVNEFATQVRQYAPNTGGDMLTYAEELRQEGRIEGKIEGTVETIENLLAVGAEWSLISKATGITPEEFDQLKLQIKRLAAESAGENAPTQ
jgi:predicted transposase YdaD